GQGLDWLVKGPLAGMLSLLLAVALPFFLLRVSRVQRLSSSALEISRGDLSSRVMAESGSLRDDIDELAVAISNMQENLRELVSHIQNTAQLVADSANELEHSAEGVSIQDGEATASMKR